MLRKTMIQHKQTWLCFLQSPCLVPHVGPLRDSHTPHRGGLIQESVAAGERGVCVCVSVGVVVSVQHPQSTPVSHTERKPWNIKFFLFFPSFWSSFLFTTPSQDCVSVCVHVWEGRLSVNDCECVWMCACPPEQWQYVTLAGRQAGSVVLTSLSLWWLESAQRRSGFLGHTHTHINTPPPTAASQFTLTNTS